MSQRVPGWTDRIIFATKSEHFLKQRSYDSNNNLKISDHRPVFGQFELSYQFLDGFATIYSMSEGVPSFAQDNNANGNGDAEASISE